MLIEKNNFYTKKINVILIFIDKTGNVKNLYKYILI